MMTHQQDSQASGERERLTAAARSIAALGPVVSGLQELSIEVADAERAAERGYFTPAEDDRLRGRYAAYLAARQGLLDTIDTLGPLTLTGPDRRSPKDQLRAFVVSYTAACLLVRAGQFIVERFATHKIVQKKLNEAEPRFGIPRKQYTTIYKALTDPANAWRLREARHFAQANRDEIETLADDPDFAAVIEQMRDAEASLNRSVRRYLRSRLRYRWHSWRRRRASGFQRAMFAIFEASGRLIAEMRNPWHQKRVDVAIRAELDDLLRPGDVIITRHDDALSNVFLPGYWPHAAFHIGPASARKSMGIEVDPARAARWVDPFRILESMKDGVRFRSLDMTLAVDALAVIRPSLPVETIAEGISRAVTHEGKLYDFEFDFTRADRLVCTEVVYRAFDGLGPLRFELTERAGRLTLSAEDLLDRAVEDRGFEPVAVFGASSCPNSLLKGEAAREAIIASYRSD